MGVRRKLKEIHREFKLTLIYVTHDQTEALTFADQVMVMARGRAVQVGGADDLFERPAHTFVGHFIGSPGMNFLPAQWTDGARASSAPAGWMGWTPPRPRAWRTPARSSWACGPSTCGGGAGRAGRAAGAGGTGARRRHLLLTADFEGNAVRARLNSQAQAPAPGETVWLSALNTHTASATRS